MARRIDEAILGAVRKKFGPGPARPTLDFTVHSNPENVRILDWGLADRRETTPRMWAYLRRISPQTGRNKDRE